MTDSDPDIFGHFLKPDALTLTLDQLDWAIAVSQSRPTEAQQWQAYLDALALIGFAQWIEKNAPELNLHSDWLSGFEPIRAETVLPENAIASLSNVQISDFRVHLTTIELLQDGAIALPRSILDASELANSLPHFFVLIEVLEEVEQVRVYGYLRQDQLMQHQQTAALSLEDEQHYSVPLAWFDRQPESLLLLLRCVEPAAIAQRTQQASLTSSSPVSQGLMRQAVNVGRWLNNQLDELAQELSWILLPPPSLSPGLLRSGLMPTSPVEQFDALLTEFIQRSDLELPADARGAYRDFEWETIPLRLYVITWETVLNGEPTWSLLLFLGTQADASLPIGIQLEVRDEAQMLEQATITDASQDYLYVCVLGSLQEQFWVTLRLPSGISTTLPPFTFVRE